MTAAGVLDQCEAPGAEAVIGNQIDGQVGMLCAVAFGAAHRATTRRAGELSNYLDVADDLLVEPPVIEGGTLRVREGAGLGLIIDPAKLEHYRLDR
ncbi:enolase C-terminal domain-like protein [Streptomyces sp. NPDC056721]|uniref:enolase C-terminal domain-like protein n=1 Tax=Streptomyces sp. NPDC056721 TaxID=3345923 RepID=UPI003689DF28